MAQAMAEGEAFDVAEYLASDDADEPGSDAARVVEYMDRAARCLGLDAVDWAMIDDLNEAISDLFRSEKVIGLVNAISTALCKRGRIGEVGLGLLHERNLPEHEWVRLPSELANRWLENYRV